MIIGYDKNPSITDEQRLQSLVESVQRAMDEMREEIERLKKELEERTE